MGLKFKQAILDLLFPILIHLGVNKSVGEYENETLNHELRPPLHHLSLTKIMTF